MNCYEVKEKLGSFIDGELPENEGRMLGDHLATCYDCMQELEAVKKIQSLVTPALYTEPDEQYWNDLPVQIMQKLGIETAPVPKSSWLESVAAAVFSLRSLQVGFAGVAVLFLVMFLLKNKSIDRADSVSPASVPGVQVQVNRSMANAEQDANSAEPPAAPGQAGMTSDHSTFGPVPAATPNDVIPQKNSSPAEQPRVFASTVEKIRDFRQPVADPGNTRNLASSEPLIPIPNAAFVEGLEDNLENDLYSEESIQKTAALTHKVLPASSASQNRSADVPDGESSFSETMWIVQHSTSVKEKKNIWLSYIKRETDPTYRSLGVYHLALVLAKIAEQKRDFESAKAAYDFFMENQKSLRFQMKERRFAMKLKVLKMLMEQAG